MAVFSIKNIYIKEPYEKFINKIQLLNNEEMGRIKTKLTKRVTLKLVKMHRDEFKKDFKSNKELVTKFADIPSKKLRNIIAGYVTRLVNTKE